MKLQSKWIEHDCMNNDRNDEKWDPWKQKGDSSRNTAALSEAMVAKNQFQIDEQGTCKWSRSLPYDSLLVKTDYYSKMCPKARSLLEYLKNVKT